MKKVLNRVILIAAILSIALVGTISFAAWSGDLTKNVTGGGAGTVKIVSFNDATAVALSGTLLPWDQVDTGKTAAFVESEDTVTLNLVVNTLGLETTDSFTVTIGNFTNSAAGGDIAYFMYDDAAAIKPSGSGTITNPGTAVANSAALTFASTKNAAQAITIRFYMSSTNMLDMGTTVSFDVTLAVV